MARYLLGIVPNFLGPTTFGAFFLFSSPFLGGNQYRKHAFEASRYLRNSAQNSFVFLIFWEIMQNWLPKAVFDWNDILWAGIGTVVYYRIGLKMIKVNRA
jgi:hypothetical protein